MKKVLSWLGALVALLLLPACVGMGTGLGSADPSEGVTDEWADKFILATTTPERTLRACMGAAVISEVWVYRLTLHPSTLADRTQARAAVSQISLAIQNIREFGSVERGPWFETEIFYAVAYMLQGVEDSVKSRVLGGLSAAILGDFRSLFGGLRATAGQMALATVMIRDIEYQMESKDLSDPDQFEQAWADCQARLTYNLDRLS